jgi:hypothetical protein
MYRRSKGARAMSFEAEIEHFERIVAEQRKPIAELEKGKLARCAEESEKQSEYEGGLLDRIAELEAQVQHLADVNTERQLRIRQLETMIIKNQAEDLKEHKPSEQPYNGTI